MRATILFLALIAVWAARPATPALAQSSPGIVKAAYGGGNGDTWREMIDKPFSRATGIPVQIADLANPEVPIRSAGESAQYNVAWLGYFQATTLYYDGLTECFDAADFSNIQNVPEKLVLKERDGKIIGFLVQFQY